MVDFKYYFKEFLRNLKLGFVNNKYFLLFSIALFIIPALIGYLYADNLSLIMEPLIKGFINDIDVGNIQLTTFSLFANNLRVDFVLFVGSALFAVFGMMILMFNGIFIGYFGTKSPIIPFLALILPHGIFEIPSMIISALAGFIVLSFIIKSIKFIINSDLKISERLKLAYNTNFDMLKQALSLFILAIILVFIAAFIEANLTRFIAFNILNIRL